MQSFRCLRLAARPLTQVTTPASTLLRPSIAQIAVPQCSSRTFSLLSPRRPQLTNTASLPSPASTTSTVPEASTPDLLPRISSHPGLQSLQIRCGPRDTYDPSHLVRKRRHGFLARLRTRKGRKILKRRQLKGRTHLSH